jgi:hypothetical protein
MKIQHLWNVAKKDGDFWADLANLLAMLEPVIQTLAALESERAPTSRVYERFKCLLEHRVYGKGSGRQTPLQEKFTDAIGSCWNSIRTNAIDIAFLLDPLTNLSDFMGRNQEESTKL